MEVREGRDVALWRAAEGDAHHWHATFASLGASVRIAFGPMGHRLPMGRTMASSLGERVLCALLSAVCPTCFLRARTGGTRVYLSSDVGVATEELELHPLDTTTPAQKGG